MNSSDLLVFALDWLSKNDLSLVVLLLVVLLIAVIPVVAIGVVGYTVHVLKVIQSTRK